MDQQIALTLVQLRRQDDCVQTASVTRLAPTAANKVAYSFKVPTNSPVDSIGSAFLTLKVGGNVYNLRDPEINR